MNGLIVDSFAGGGGASQGIAWALGRSPDVAINHDASALAMHEANHPSTRHVHEDVWKAAPRKVTKGRRVALLWASPDCKHFSRAKGGKPVEKSIRSLAWVVVRWAVETKPAVIVLENVREFEDWGPLGADARPDKARKGLTFKRFCGRLRGLGYVVEHRTLNAADFGAPTHRRRLFLIARRDGLPIEWPEPTHGDPKKLGSQPLFERLKPWRTAAECIDWSIPCPSIFDRKRPLAEKTLRRIALGIKRYVLDNPQPFIVQLAHGEGRDGLDKPLGTAVSGGKHGLVAATLMRQFGTSSSANIDAPAPTVMPDGGGKTAVVALPTTTAIATQNQIVAANMVKMNHGEKQWYGADEPLPTSTTANHMALVYSFLVKYFRTAIGAHLPEPAPTATGKDRFGLVTVSIDGQPYVIADIGMRMLTPRELARAQGFPDTYELTGTKTSQVAKIGNSVCPHVAAAIVRANCVALAAEVKAHA